MGCNWYQMILIIMYYCSYYIYFHSWSPISLNFTFFRGWSIIYLFNHALLNLMCFKSRAEETNFLWGWQLKIETQNVCFTDLLKSYQTVYETMSMTKQDTNMSLLQAFSGGGGGGSRDWSCWSHELWVGSTGMNYCIKTSLLSWDKPSRWWRTQENHRNNQREQPPYLVAYPDILPKSCECNIFKSHGLKQGLHLILEGRGRYLNWTAF